MSTARHQQIQALYEAALERPPGERASFVAALTGEDAQLRQSVELLLSKQDTTDVGSTVAPEEDALELPVGTRIGQYRIDGVLGRGGMGVVYRATDTKLHRPVAIKFLSSAVADAGVRQRFAQEADTTSGLNHPHIVTVYDVGEHDGAQYIVSELVDGGTLDDSITSTRKRSWRQSVELLTGVADALAAAHAAGVLHRDVKPGNILIGSNGYAKLGDFGLAKLVGDRLRAGASGARSVRHTRAGLVVGTVAYMSPEQASGQPLDARSDAFSFGVVLYELLAGKRPFEGANDLETLKAIAHATPEPLPDDVPELLRMVLDKALEKEPADRYQTMQDLVADLKRVTRKQASSQTAVATNASRRGVHLPWVVATALGVALVAALASLVTARLRPAPSPAAEVRFQIPVPDYAPNGLAVSPDGAQVAYAAVTGGERRIWVRPLAGMAARPVPGTEGAQGVFWSPDSRRLAFLADNKLKTVGNAGEAPAVVTDVGPAVSLRGVWLGDGTILLTVPGPRGDLGIGRVAAGGGTPAPVVSPDPTQSMSLVLPVALPDGEHVLYGSGFELGPVGIPTGREIDVRLGSLAAPAAGAPLSRIGRRDWASGYVPGLGYAAGFLVFQRESTLFAQRFDADALELRGDAVSIADDVAEFSAAANLLVYRTFGPGAAGEGRRTRRLVWFDRNGERLDEVDTPPVYRLPALSPDGRQISLSQALDGPPDVWTIDIQRGTTTRLTFDPAFDDITVWSPDSTRIAFNSSRDSAAVPNSIYERAANGTGVDTRLFSAPAGELLVPFDWSRDGRWLVFGRSSAAWQSGFDLWVLELAGERTAAPLIESPFIKAQARFSPDTRWIAYISNESNGNQIVVQPFPDLARGRWQVSTRGGQEPRWSPDGSELFYMDPDGVLMAVDVSTDGDALEPGLPRPLFRTGVTLPGPNDAPEWLYAVAPDGERFLINEPIAAASSAEADAANAPQTPMLNVIVNWTATLGQR